MYELYENQVRVVRKELTERVEAMKKLKYNVNNGNKVTKTNNCKLLQSNGQLSLREVRSNK